MKERCSLCNQIIYGHHVYCDVIEGIWHLECFNFERCEEKHGEGCMTLVLVSEEVE